MVSRSEARCKKGCRVGLYSVSSGRDMVGAASCHPHVKCVKSVKLKEGMPNLSRSLICTRLV